MDELDEIRNAFPSGQAELEDAMINLMGADLSTVYAMSEQLWGPPPDNWWVEPMGHVSQNIIPRVETVEVSWVSVVVGLTMVFLCAVLTIAGL